MNKKQQLFCDEYLKDYNGARAYREAYKTTNNETAFKNASRLLQKNAEVRAYIEEQNEKLHNERIASVEEIRELLSEIARGTTEKRYNDGYRSNRRRTYKG